MLMFLMYSPRVKDLFGYVQSFVQCCLAVVSCGWLDIPFSVRQGELRYTVGSHVTVIGCMPGYKMTGVQTTYVCEATSSTSATWSPNIAQTCYCECSLLLNVVMVTVNL